MRSRFVPVTPAGTACFWLASDTEDEAWRRLLEEAAHMPYDGIEGFRQRGYTIAVLSPVVNARSGKQGGA